ncbi:MAG: Rieske 2Fe-2S family protein [Pseudohongiellaceae bacterium]|jgi:Rieske 2Fe-2S family protein
MNDYKMINVDCLTSSVSREKVQQMLSTRDSRYTLEQALYNNEQVFQMDMDEVFNKEWIFIGMSCEIPNRGDYITADVGQNPVLIVRDADGSINAFHNSCRHRGSRLCSAAKGKVANLVCPYHQWTYDLKGNLLFTGTDVIDNFDKNEHRLGKAHCAVGGGFIFVSLHQQQPEKIQDFIDSMDEYMEPYDIENTKIAAESSTLEKANWKLVMENNRECYHCAIGHPDLIGSLIEYDDINDPRAPQSFLDYYAEEAAEWDANHIPHERRDHTSRNRLVRMPLKKGTEAMTADGTRACDKLMGRIKNHRMGSLRILHLPNSWNHMQSDHCVVFRVLPISAQETLVTTKWIVHKDAVEGKDYDIEKLCRVWHSTNNEDKGFTEESQRGINSIGYRPGPYAPAYEFAVINFVNWYAQTMLKNMES